MLLLIIGVSGLIFILILIIIAYMCCRRKKNKLKKIDIFSEYVDTERTTSLFDTNGFPNENRKYTEGGTPQDSRSWIKMV